MTTSKTSARITPRELPYSYTALLPEISEETMRFHHDKHYEGYVKKLNELIEGTPYEGHTPCEILLRSEGAVFNNAAQIWNHEFYFEQLAPVPQTAPTGDLLRAVEEAFGSTEELIKQMNLAAAGLFGSGWIWLVKDAGGKLSIVSEPNAGNPLCRQLTPLICIDVWEHAYYIDYRNRRPDAIAALWNRLDWHVVEERYAL